MATPIGADTLAGVDTLVYARLSVYVSPGVDLEVSSGYQFIDKPDTHFPKHQPETRNDEGETGSFTVAVHPNARRGGIRRVQMRSSYGEGPVSVSLYDLSGRRVSDRGTLALRSGEGSGRLDAGGLRAGVYVLTARQGERVATARVVVTR